jgi:NADP-dependent aldehyde dehydrogenase
MPVPSLDPRTGSPTGWAAPEASTSDVDGAVRAAVAAVPVLAALGIAGRAELLRAVAEELEADGEAIIDAADAETALGRPRLTGELARTGYQLRFLADVLADGEWLGITIDHADPNAQPAPRPDLRRLNVPLGPVAVFAASNFPLAFSVPGGDTASALAAGCPVVVKAHPGHPRTASLCADALNRAAPAGAIAVLHGWQAGLDLVNHPMVAAVGFTGSVPGGRALFDLAAARPRPIPFYGELGSLNPLVVTPAAADERGAEIAAGLAASITGGVGQFCTKPGLVILPASPAGDALREALQAALSGVDGGPMLTGGIRSGYLAGVSERSGVAGVRTLLAADAGAGFAASPALLSLPATEVSAPLLEECFGPAAVCLTYADESEVDGVLALLDGSLTATVHCGADADPLAAALLPRLAALAGRVIVNGYPTGVAVTWAMQHGGPYPSSTAAGTTSVGAAAIGRWVRPVVYQSTPPDLLPPELREDNPLRLPRRVDGRHELR